MASARARTAVRPRRPRARAGGRCPTACPATSARRRGASRATGSRGCSRRRPTRPLPGRPSTADHDYGEPASPSWRDVDWSSPPARRRDRWASRCTTSDLGDGRRAADRVRARPRRELAELAREPPARGGGPPGDRPRPAWLRGVADAAGTISIPGYARTVEAWLDGARPRPGRARRQLDGRIHRRRGGDRVPGPRGAPGARGGGRDLDHEPAPPADQDGRPDRRGRRRDHRSAQAARSSPAAAFATW